MLGIQPEPQLIAVVEGGAALRVELPDQTTAVQVAPDALWVGITETEAVGISALAEGPQGAMGLSVYSGTGTPPNGLGRAGETYIDVATGNVWIKS